ncbi:MAG: hypothetical protein H0W50_05415 [Parachlamydiaceae bacterium]|nr:hypothetical protein [Parachlamydiaceae bacterium]
MKKLVLTAMSSLCLLAISAQAYSMPMSDTMISGSSSQMMNMKMTENDLYSQLNFQDKAMYDKLDAQQRAFVLRVVSSGIQMMNMNSQGQMQDGGMMNRGNIQQDGSMMNRGNMQQDGGMMNRGNMQQDRGMNNQR